MRRSLIITGLVFLTALMLILGGNWMSRGMATAVDRFAEGSTEREVAEAAHMAGEGLARQTMLPRRLYWLIPAVRVVDVRRSPGNCTEYPEGSVRNADYTATIRVYTLFRIPVRKFTLLCGANYL